MSGRLLWWGATVLAMAAGQVPAAPEHPAHLMLWDCDSTAGIAGLTLETADVKQGRGAVRWRNHPQTPNFTLPKVPADWTGYHVLRFQLHSAKAVPTRIMVIVTSENPATEGDDYWGFPISLNFTGWRQIDLPLGEYGQARSPRGWNQIDRVSLTAAGWGNTPHPEADLLLDAFELVVDPPRPGPLLSDDEFFAGIDLARPGLEAVKAAVDRSDMAGAKTALLAYWRARQKPKWWLDWRDRPQGGPVTGGSAGWDYYATQITVDWTGWRTVRIPLKSFYASRQPIGWHHIDYLAFSASYGDRHPSGETLLSFDDIRLEGPQPRLLADFESDQDFRRWPGLQPSTSHVKSGKQAGLWAALDQTSTVTLVTRCRSTGGPTRR